MFDFLQSGSPSNSLEWIIFFAVEYKESFFQGTVLTLYVSIMGTLLGFILGFVMGVVDDISIEKESFILKRIFLNLLKGIQKVYIEIFRGTPMIVQGMVIYYGLRQMGVPLTSVFAGILVTFLNTGAYMAETVRGGIKSINIGQKEGAYAMGMSPLATMIYVVLPQAFRNVIPEMANMFLTNLKMTSVLNVIGVSELFLTAKTVAGNYYKYFEAYLVIAIIYFVLCFIVSRLISVLEKKLDNKNNYTLAVEYVVDSEKAEGDLA